jgi:dihydropteroate synthase-like protein
LRVLLVTGLMAREIVERYTKESSLETTVLPLPVSIAAFLTPIFVAEKLRERDLTGYDLILLPGAVRGDVSVVEAATGVPTFKGPVYAADIPSVLRFLGEVELSKTVAASELLRERLREDALREMEVTEMGWRRLIEEGGGFRIGRGLRGVAVGRLLPMRVVAEIVDAPRLNDEEIAGRAAYYQRSGADILDLGMMVGSPRPEEVKRVVEAVRSKVDLPLSIDTLDPSEIRAAVKADIDLVLSLDRGNIEEVAPLLQETPAVVLPTDTRKGEFPRGAAERVAVLEKTINEARGLGVERIIADPVLEPAVNPGLSESLAAYRLFAQRNSRVPMLFGVGNVTELMDVDSVGVNGLLAAIAAELGASLLFTPEHSDKAKGSARELAAASEMMFLSAKRKSVPKDLGVDLLVLKDKRFREEEYDKNIEKDIEVLEPREAEGFQEDERGWFRLLLDREEDRIVLLHFPSREATRPDLVLKGAEATPLYLAIVEHELVSRLDHAAYLGRELAKAEVALRTGKTYIQDAPLFPKD